jgi:hypothetical protein
MSPGLLLLVAAQTRTQNPYIGTWTAVAENHHGTMAFRPNLTFTWNDSGFTPDGQKATQITTGGYTYTAKTLTLNMKRSTSTILTGHGKRIIPAPKSETATLSVKWFTTRRFVAAFRDPDQTLVMHFTRLK